MGKIAEAVRGTGLSEQKRQQMLSLDQEFSDMEAEIQSLQTENLHLRALVKPLEREINRLKKQVEEMQSESAHVDDLDETATKLLEALGHSDGRMPMYATSRHFNLSNAQANFYFSMLRARGFIIQSTVMADPGYRTTPEGLAYLHDHGLL